jgi:hypothetical protein
MVWCGVVWCGVVWCGVVWCGVVWCGVVWCGVVWYGVVRIRAQTPVSAVPEPLQLAMYSPSVHDLTEHSAHVTITVSMGPVKHKPKPAARGLYSRAVPLPGTRPMRSIAPDYILLQRAVLLVASPVHALVRYDPGSHDCVHAAQTKQPIARRQ